MESAHCSCLNCSQYSTNFQPFFTVNLVAPIAIINNACNDNLRKKSEGIICLRRLRRHAPLEFLSAYPGRKIIGSGFTHLHFHSANPDQQDFNNRYDRDVLPALR
jgi:hypothetical protein